MTVRVPRSPPISVTSRTGADAGTASNMPARSTPTRSDPAGEPSTGELTGCLHHCRSSAAHKSSQPTVTLAGRLASPETRNVSGLKLSHA